MRAKSEVSLQCEWMYHSVAVERAIMKHPVLVLSVPTVLALVFGATTASAANSLKVVARSARGGHYPRCLCPGPTGNNLPTLNSPEREPCNCTWDHPGAEPGWTDLADFSGAPEKILGLAGYWFVVSKRRVTASRDRRPHGAKSKRRTNPFDDCELSHDPKVFVTYSQKRLPAGDRYSIQTFRPDGSPIAERALVVTPGGTIGGDASAATFLGFTKSHLQAMVQKPGQYKPAQRLT